MSGIRHTEFAFLAVKMMQRSGMSDALAASKKRGITLDNTDKVMSIEKRKNKEICAE